MLSAPDPDVRKNQILQRAEQAATTALAAAGHTVRTIDLRTFSPVLTRPEMAAYVTDQPLIHEQTTEYAQAVLSCDALILVYATTMSTLPPALKGWLDRVLVPGVSFTLDGSGGTKRGLAGLDWIIGISVYSDTWLATKRTYDNGRRILMRNLRLCARLGTRTAWLPLYSATAANEQRSAAFIKRIERRMAKL